MEPYPLTRISSQPFISEQLSVYLDVLRFSAALAVLVGHLDQDGLYASWLVIGNFSHAAVVVFFVLSGLVISQSAYSRENDWRSYAVARFARIYSVVLPAILLSFAVKALAVWLDPNSLADEFFDKDLRLSNLFGAIFFLNESWGIGTSLPWNGPFWTLCYEVWFYAIFGLAFFIPGRSRWAWVALATLVAGPAIAVLFPVWLLGSWLAKHGGRFVMGQLPSLLLWCLSLLAFVVLNESGIDVSLRGYLHNSVPGFWRLEGSQRFITDYLLGILVAINFVAFRGLGEFASRAMAAIKAPVVFLAGYTFSLYLFHRPLTKFGGHFFPNREQSVVITLLWLVSIVCFCFLLGSVTEQKKQILRTWGRRVVGRAQGA